MILVALLVLSITPLLGLWLLQRRFVFQPDRTDPGKASDWIAGGEDVRLRTADGLSLGAWFVPPTAGHCRIRVLVTPGNGGNRAGRVELASALAARGFGVLLLDYRGYGGNPGRPDEAGVSQDALAGREFLARSGSDHKIIYFGESLGAAVATRLAVDHPPAALILRSPFVDLAAMARVHFPVLPVGLILRDKFRVSELVAGVRAPLTVIWGTGDRIVPPAQSRAVADAATGVVSRVEVRGGDHNDAALAHGPQVIDAVVAAAAAVDDSGCGS